MNLAVPVENPARQVGCQVLRVGAAFRMDHIPDFREGIVGVVHFEDPGPTAFRDDYQS